MNGYQRTRAGSAYSERRPPQIEQIGDASGHKIRERTQVRGHNVARICRLHLEALGAAGAEHSHILSTGMGEEAGTLQGLPGTLQEKSVLGIDGLGFSERQSK